jgi:membrane fusion protein, copper/silver efflux system
MRTWKALAVSGSCLVLALLAFLPGDGVRGFLGKDAGRAWSAEPRTPAGHAGHGAGATGVQTEKPAEPMPPQHGQEEPPTIEIPPEKQQLIGLRIEQVSVAPLQRNIRTVGRVEIDEKRLATVNTKFEGWIERLYVDYTGRHVRKGEPLAEVYSPELYATQREFVNLLKWTKEKKSGDSLGNMLFKDAESILDAARQRLRLWDITEDQIRKIEETGKPIRTLTLYSPVSGVVVQKMAVLGMRAMPGEKLFDVADLSTIWVIADIYENEMPFVRVGQTARITLSYLPGEELNSKIDYVYPAHSLDTRTMKVRFTMPNPRMELMPQMYAQVAIRVDLGRRLLVPDDSIIETGTRNIVYVDKGEGLFEPREVMLGVRAERFVEVTMGLEEGERVARSAAFLIDSEAQLKGVAPLGGHKH